MTESTSNFSLPSLLNAFCSRCTEMSSPESKEAHLSSKYNVEVFLQRNPRTISSQSKAAQLDGANLGSCINQIRIHKIGNSIDLTACPSQWG